MRLKLASCLFAGALVLAACGGDDDTTASGTTEADSGATTTTAADSGASGAAAVSTAMTDLGNVLVDANGMTVYAFTADTGGVSTCTGACADTWPAVTVEDEDLPAGLDSAIFSVSEPEEGVYQLAAKDQPLYTFSGDTAAGDTNGQGVGDTWFAVSPDGQLLRDAATGGSGGATTTAPPTTADNGY